MAQLPAPGAPYKIRIPPYWYQSTGLPLFYDRGDGIYLRPTGGPNAPAPSDNDVYDVMIYQQQLIGWNRNDLTAVSPWMGAVENANWLALGHSGFIDARSALKQDAYGDGSGNFASVPNKNNNDDARTASFQQRIIDRYSDRYPWLKDVQKAGGGIDWQTICDEGDVEIPRPAWLPAYLPSLFVRKSNGFLTTRFKIYKYNPTTADLAAMILYMFPVIAKGATPYDPNWYSDNDNNGAKLAALLISNTLDQTKYFSANYLYAGAELGAIGWANLGNLFTQPAIVYQGPGVIAQVTSAIISKVPVLGQLKTLVTNWADTINAKNYPPDSIAAQVAADVKSIADGIADETQAATQTKTNTTIGIAVFGFVLLLVIIFYSISKKK